MQNKQVLEETEKTDSDNFEYKTDQNQKLSLVNLFCFFMLPLYSFIKV